MSFLRMMRNAAGRATGHSGCFRCGDTWDWKEAHVTEYGSHDDGRPIEGCFPLCEECWEELTPAERWPYYERLLEYWQRERSEQRGDLYRAALGKPAYYEEKRRRLHKAVFAGK